MYNHRKIKSGIIIKSVESTCKLSRDAQKNTAGIAASEVLKLLNANGGVELILKKGLPLGSGLGSSAASAAASAFAANYLYGNKLFINHYTFPILFSLCENRVYEL